MVKKHLQQGLAFEWVHALDMRRKPAIHKQYLFAGFGVRHDNWVFILRISIALWRSYLVVAKVGQCAVMHRGQIFQKRFHGVAQQVKGKVHIRE